MSKLFKTSKLQKKDREKEQWKRPTSLMQRIYGSRSVANSVIRTCANHKQLQLFLLVFAARHEQWLHKGSHSPARCVGGFIPTVFVQHAQGHTWMKSKILLVRVESKECTTKNAAVSQLSHSPASFVKPNKLSNSTDMLTLIVFPSSGRYFEYGSILSRVCVFCG